MELFHVILLIGALLASNSVQALNPREPFVDYVNDNWGIEHGLPQTSVHSITQDNTGYIWVGTQNGIARFDGVRFTVFDRHSDGVDTTMATAALTGADGRLWFATPHGVLVYADGHFSLLRAGNGNAAVFAIAQTRAGEPLFSTALGVMQYRDGEIMAVMLDGEPCYGLLRDEGGLWVGGVGKLTRIGVNGAVSRFPLPPSAASARVTHLVTAVDGLWLGTADGLYRMRMEKIAEAGVDPELGRLSIESLFRDHDGNLWIGTSPALFRLDVDEKVQRIAPGDFTRDSWVQTIFEDRENNLWLGSHTEGLFRLWNGWTQRVSDRDGLADSFVWSVVKSPQGQIVLGTNSDVALVTEHGARQLIAGKDLPNASAYELSYDRDGSLWVGTRSGVAIYSRGKIERPAALTALDPYQINAIVQVGDDHWIGTTGGLYRYRNGQLLRIGMPTGAATAHVRCIYVVGDDELLIGTESGIRHVRADAIDTPAWALPLEGVFVSSIAPIRKGLLGITTLDAGFGLQSAERLIMLTRDQGLPSDNGWAFRVVDERLYMAGIDGVWRLPLGALPDPTALAAGAALPIVTPQIVLSPIGRGHGSQRVRCCNGGALARSVVDGHNLWFATISGALRVDTDAINTAPPPTAVVESIRFAGHHYPTDKTDSSAAPLVLNGQPRDVEVEFTGIAFREPQSLAFRYRLDGYDTGWVDASTRRSAFYTNLPTGTYRFRVEAILPGGIEGPQGEFNFSLAPGWYERAIVQWSATCAGLGLAALLLMQRIRRYRAQQAQLERVVDTRTQALRRANERLRQANQTLAQESQTDPLTGLHNRRFLLDQVNNLLLARAREGGELAFVLLDLDNFKQINDTLGHAAGDEALVHFSHFLQRMARAGDHTLRWGGEEFLLLLDNVGPAQTLDVAERLRSELAQHSFTLSDGRQLRLTCSIGFALYPLATKLRQEYDWTLTLELADAALYRIKEQGRNGCAGLVAGPDVARASFNAQDLHQIDQLVANGSLRWLQPTGIR